MSLLSKIYSTSISSASYAMIYNAYIHGFLCLAIEQENISLVESYRLINLLRLIDLFFKVMFNSLRYVQPRKQ